MRYTVGTDTDKSTYEAFMTAAGQSGIPTAFIVGKTGKIEWIGHPMGMDEPLEKIVNDTWDSTAYKKEFDAQVASEAARKVLFASLMDAQSKGDWDGMVKLLDGHIKEHPDDSDAAMMKMQVLLTKANKPEAGYEVARDIAAKNADNAMILNAVAWTILDAPGIEKRDYALATEIAQKANKKSGEKDPMILDTLARCYWENGDHAKAIELQKKAVGLVDDPRLAEQLKQTLEKYESSK
jgi:tetratricopeptide (TPR) repeat protein